MTPTWFRRVLRYRPGQELATGYDVAVVARKLRCPTQVYGPVLESKVRGFQRLRGLHVDGIVDLDVARALGEVNLFVPDWFDESLPSETIATAQRLFDIRADGVKDDAFDNAVRRFQSGRGLSVTGILDAETAKWMGEL